jgi:4-amino-4-deoxychorismate lyase
MWVDGFASDSLPVTDRGLNYGDGLFETIRVEHGGAPLLERHLSRLRTGCARLALPLPGPQALRRELSAACDGMEEGILKLVLTRGSGGRGYAPPEAPSCRRVISTHPLPDYPRSRYRDGVSVRLCTTPLGTHPATAGLKHLGRLDQVLASMEPPAGTAEGLMCDASGQVIEGIRSNLFLVRGGQLLTPDLAGSGVAGVMRGLVLDLAPSLDLEPVIEPVSTDDLVRCDEMFLSSSIFGIWPVREVRALTGFETVGPATRRLMSAVAALGVKQWAP